MKKYCESCGKILDEEQYHMFYKGGLVIYNGVIRTFDDELSPAGIERIEVGSRFTAACDYNIYPTAIGKFIVIDFRNPDKGDFILSNSAKVSRYNGPDESIFSKYIVLPTIASGYWDREIEHVVARKYEGPMFDYMLTTDISEDDIPAIPYILRKLEMNGLCISPKQK